MQLNGATLDQYSFKGLNTQAVQRGSTVQQHRVIFNHFFQYIPHLRLDPFDKAFRALNIMSEVLLHQLAHDKWLKEFQCHLLGKATLMQLQFWADHNHRAARIVYTLTEQVLAETPLLAFEHI